MLQRRNFNHNYSSPASELPALLRKASTLTGAYNTGYTAHYIRLIDNLYFGRNGRKEYLSEIYKIYDCIDDNGRENLGDWIGKAAKAAGR